MPYRFLHYTNPLSISLLLIGLPCVFPLFCIFYWFSIFTHLLCLISQHKIVAHSHLSCKFHKTCNHIKHRMSLIEDIVSLMNEFVIGNNLNKKEDKFYIGSNENPSTQLVPFKMDGTSFLIWRKQFRMVVNAKKKLSFLIGSIPRPIDEKEEDFEKWSMSNDMVHLWIEWSHSWISPDLLLLWDCLKFMVWHDWQVWCFKWPSLVSTQEEDCNLHLRHR